MKSPRDIIDALGGPTEFGRICGFTKNPASRGSDMRQRGSIPVASWPKLVEVARTRGLQIDNDVLVRVHAPTGSAFDDDALVIEQRERAKPLRCFSTPGIDLATEGQSR